MAIDIGTKLGDFEVLSLLGVGGMGEVYRARDTRLGREVALKLLPETLARDETSLARLEREALLLASINHPNIETLHGFQESDGLRFLVMELVPGETLASKLTAGRIGVEESLSIARQIAGALEAAHERGIIHRDLKPANVKITPSGMVKLLDFGLAKAVAQEDTPPLSSESITLIRASSTPGLILGTASYMSPEQARGRALDRTTDIWSFGCVLFEILTGRMAFPGETGSDIVASILAKEPDWARIPDGTPLKIRDLLRRCLHKDPRQRLRDIGDARIEIDEALAEPSGAFALSRPSFSSIAVALAAALAAGIAVWSLTRPTEGVRPVVSRFALHLPPEEALTHLNDPVVALTPDGTRLVYVGGNPTRLFVRPLEQMTASAIPATEDAIAAFPSADGQWVGFYGRGKLEKVPIGGGVPVALCDAPNPWGASWGDGDSILFSPATTSGLSRVSASGGDPVVVTRPDPREGEVSHRWPEFLPGGKAALFTIWTGASQGARIALLDLATSKYRVLMEGASFARYLTTGHLVYVREGQVAAAPFDLQSLEVTGPPVPLSMDVLTQTAFGSAQYSLSGDGSLAYVPGASAPARTLVWVDRKGAARPLTEIRSDYEHPRLSPDGRRLAVTTWEDKAHISVYDLERDALTRLSGPEGQQPIWTPDGGRVTYRSAPFDLVWRSADGSGAIEKLASLEGAGEPSSWSLDGNVLVFTDIHPSSGPDIWVLSLDGDRKPRPFVQTPAAEAGGAFSPDGRWIAYDSKESGRLEVYVQPFPGPGGRWQISTEGGRQAHWARNGREIFYRSGGDKMMAVEVETNPAFRVSKPEVLFEGIYAGGVESFGSANYDVTGDGQRFVMIRTEEETAPARIHVVLNWAEELKRARP